MYEADGGVVAAISSADLPSRQGGQLRDCRSILADQGHRRLGQVGVLFVRAGLGLGEVPELGQHRGRGRALPGHAVQAGGDELGQFTGQAGQVGFLGGQPGQHVHDRVALVGRVPGGREQQRRAEGVHVAGHRRLVGVPGLLGRHVRGRADGAARRWCGPSARPPGPRRSRSPAARRARPGRSTASGPGAPGRPRGSNPAPPRTRRPATARRSPAADRRPSTRQAERGVGTYAVASQGRSASGSASTTAAVNTPLTFRAAATSCANRCRKPASSASSTLIVLTATSRPAAERPRYTCPIDPAPRRPSTTKGPIRSGSHLRSVSRKAVFPEGFSRDAAFPGEAVPVPTAALFSALPDQASEPVASFHHAESFRQSAAPSPGLLQVWMERNQDRSG